MANAGFLSSTVPSRWELPQIMIATVPDIPQHTHRLQSSSFLGLPYRILSMTTKRNDHGAQGVVAYDLLVFVS